MKLLVVCAIFVFLVCLPTSASAQILLVVEKPEVAMSLRGIVLDASAAPLYGVDVVELSADGKSELQSATTAEDGSFHLKTPQGDSKHLLEFRQLGFNPLRIHVVVKKSSKRALRIQMEPSA